MGSYLRRIECSKVSFEKFANLANRCFESRHFASDCLVTVFCFVSFSHLAVPMPPMERLAIKDVFDSNGKPKAEVLKNHFLKEGRVEEDVAIKIINSCTDLLRTEPTMLEVEAPITGIWTGDLNCTNILSRKICDLSQA